MVAFALNALRVQNEAGDGTRRARGARNEEEL